MAAASQEVLLIRHGETEWSLSGQHTSRTDLPLTENGRRMAALAGAALHDRTFALVLVSPLRRARETCQIAGLGAQAHVRDDLKEWDYGDYEGLTTPEIRERRPGWSLWRDGCPGGESPEEVGVRVDRVLDLVTSGDGAGPGGGHGPALMFAHGHILRVLSARWIGLEVDGGSRLVLKPAAVGLLGHERETRAIEGWNVTELS